MLLRFLHRAVKARLRDHRVELIALTRAVRPGDTAVDVGANKGSHLLWLSRAAGAGRVVAFEPQPALAEYLRRACRAARLRNVTVEATGVSDRAGELSLHIPGTGDSPGASFEPAAARREACRAVTVPVVTLDGYFAGSRDRIAAMKIDVEGHEAAVLRGAARILAEHRPILVFECEQRHLSTGRVVDVLRGLIDLGYEGWFAARGVLRPVGEFDPETHQRQAGERFWDDPSYCNNFIFRPRGGRSL